MAFESDVVVRAVGHSTWELAEPLQYTGNRDTFVVPAGFRTDFASVPRAFVWLLPSYGRYTKAAILHDFLCQESKAGRVNRADADGLFRRSMRELGVPFLRRWIMWGAVALATLWISLRARRRVPLSRLWRLVVLGIPSVVFFVIPAAVVTLWLVLFWVAEAIAFLVLLPFSRRKVNRPKFNWRMS